MTFENPVPLTSPPAAPTSSPETAIESEVEQVLRADS